MIRYLADHEPVGDLLAAVRDNGGRSETIRHVRHIWRTDDAGGAEAWTMVELRTASPISS